MFFSIVVPAHNEEAYIVETLEHLKNLNYPQGLFEVIVVENGSTDDTYTRALHFQQGNIRVVTSATKGVSAARNLGSALARADSSWVIFLDADTLLGPSFLLEMSLFLTRHSTKRYTVGVFSVRPSVNTLFSKLFFAWGNISRFFTKLPYTVFAIRRDLFPAIESDESLAVSENVSVCKRARVFGDAFFMRTHSVTTSTRRFEAEGYVGMSVLWIRILFMNHKKRKQMVYPVVR